MLNIKYIEAKNEIKKKEKIWYVNGEKNIYCDEVKLPKGSIEKLIGKKLTWKDEPVKVKEN